ncbi:MAG: hypothetical protein M3Z23_16795 [Acidobacteriota bacterium]|nr:hypothetical protein [Acidobacteriota bacterium]
MPEETLYERANRDMEAATVFLLVPDAHNLDSARALLQDAAGALTRLKLLCPSSDLPDYVSSDRMRALHRKVGMVSQLLQSAAAFHGGTAVAVARLSAAYAPGGRMTPASRTSQVSVDC